jgi:hypothetical protein
MKVYKLTPQEKDSLVGQNYTTLSQFNPIEDNNGDWVISTEEVDNCTNLTFQWVKNLPLIDYEPIQEELPEMSPLSESVASPFVRMGNSLKKVWDGFKNIF